MTSHSRRIPYLAVQGYQFFGACSGCEGSGSRFQYDTLFAQSPAAQHFQAGAVLSVPVAERVSAVRQELEDHSPVFRTEAVNVNPAHGL